MAELVPYLAFNGSCRQAMQFYAGAFGGELEMQTFGESPVEAPPETKDHVMHAQLTAGKVQLMASDAMPGDPVTVGSNVSLSVHCESEAEQDQLFGLLADGGSVSMPLQATFWGARFGMCTDRFGVHWMLNLPQA